MCMLMSMEASIGFPGTGVIHGYEPLIVGAVNRTYVLWESTMCS